MLKLLKGGPAGLLKGRSRNGAGSQEQIAEAAYFLAEKRGFEPGHELDDWLEAERGFGTPKPRRTRPKAAEKTGV